MSSEEKVVWKHIGEIEPIVTSHGVGAKRVIVSQAEIGKPVTQIAQTLLLAGEKIEKHTHSTMDEHFIVLEGICYIIVGENKYQCKGGDYLYVPASKEHEVVVKENTKLITIGVTNE